MKEFIEIIFSSGFIHSILRVSTPIIFAGLAAVFSERSGVINVSIEGVMLSSALAGVIISAVTQNLILSIVLTLMVSVLISFLLGVLVLKFKANSVMSGLALNILAKGGTVFILYLIAGSKGNSATLASLTIPNFNIPIIHNIPILGDILSGQNILTYVAIIAAILSHIFLFNTTKGLSIKSAGENPEALTSVGIDVDRTRYTALMISGVLAGLGGIFLSMGYMQGFTANMTAGRGFIGIAANAMGNQLPIGTLFAALLFGTADSAANSLQVLSVPTQFIQMIPYVTTIIGIVIYSILTTRRVRK